jgi:hypothetical protein
LPGFTRDDLSFSFEKNTLNPIQLRFGSASFLPKNNIGKNNHHIYNFGKDGSEVNRGLSHSSLNVLEGKADAVAHKEI